MNILTIKNKLFFFVAFIVYAFSILIYFIDKSPTISSFVFDFFIILFFVACIIKHIKSIPLLKYTTLLFLLILITSLQYTYYSNVTFPNWFEYARAFRFIFYLYILYILTNLNRYKYEEAIYSSAAYSQVYYITGILMLLVYSFQFIALGEKRPTLFSENNFEIPSLIIMMLISYNNPNNQTGGKFRRYLYFPVSFLSFSKSGILEAIYAFLIGRKFKFQTVVFTLPFIISLSLLALYTVISARGQMSIEEFDRYRFLMLFFDAYKSGNLFNYLFGYGIAAELPWAYCLSLDFYSTINIKPGYCNSAIFHSFFMKVLYDFGIIGLTLAMMIWFKILRNIFQTKTAIIMFGVLCISSLSVSGFGNSIIIWPVFLYLFQRLLFLPKN